MRESSRGKISIRIPDDILEFFQKDGPGYQTRINDVLRRHMMANMDIFDGWYEKVEDDDDVQQA